MASDDTVLLGRFDYQGQAHCGMLRGDQVELLPGSVDWRRFIAGELRPDGSTRMVPFADVRVLPPLEPTGRVLAVALNYRPHVDETGNIPPDRPIIFYKPPTAFVGAGGKLDANPAFTQKYDYEGEIGVVIGKPCRGVAVADALSYVAGVTALMDGSARDKVRVMAGERAFQDWLSCKGGDNTSMLGPVVATGPGLIRALRERSISLETKLNGEVVQSATSADLLFSVEQLIAGLAEFMTLLPGDVIATGTPGGIGMARGRFLTSGDQLTITIGGVPPLSGSVA